jgi:hypothetical protein
MTVSSPPKLIHVGKIIASNRPGYDLLFLRHHDERVYRWSKVDAHYAEQPTEVVADTIEEAMRLAHRHWKQQYFRTLICGFRYTLPERDEHGINALFHQMAASLGAMSGVYFDSELGCNCYVQNASQEAFFLWRELRDKSCL